MSARATAASSADRTERARASSVRVITTSPPPPGAISADACVAGVRAPCARDRLEVPLVGRVHGRLAGELEDRADRRQLALDADARARARDLAQRALHRARRGAEGL